MVCTWNHALRILFWLLSQSSITLRFVYIAVHFLFFLIGILVCVCVCVCVLYSDCLFTCRWTFVLFPVFCYCEYSCVCVCVFVWMYVLNSLGKCLTVEQLGHVVYLLFRDFFQFFPQYFVIF